MKQLSFAAGLFAAALLTGCASTCPDCGSDGSCEKCSPATEAAPAAEGENAAFNTQCPTSGRPVVASVGTVSYKGKEIGFCCAGCKGGWSQVADADKDKFIESQG